MMRSTSSQSTSSVSTNCDCSAHTRHCLVPDAQEGVAREGVLVVLDLPLDVDFVLVLE